MSGQDGYHVNNPTRFDGSACLACVVGSAMYDPVAVLGDVSAWMSGPYGARIVNRHGRITYAARHQLIGTRVPYTDQLEQVLKGHFSRRVTRTGTRWSTTGRPIAGS